MATYRVAVDVEYLDGPLAGMTIPGGHAITAETIRACAHERWLGMVRDTGDFIRASVTSNRYRPVGRISMDFIQD